ACTLGGLAVMQPPLPAPTATGSFIKTPFPHLLVYALERRLSGTFELMRGAPTAAATLLIGGCPAKVRTDAPMLPLGAILSEFGGAPSPIDPLPVLWRGVRESPQREHVDATLRRVGTALVRASATAQFERFAFSPAEAQAVELLRRRPVRAVDVNQAVGSD